jgi:hypothetical protein
MTLKEHLSYGAVASAALYPVLGPKVAFFYIPSVLIDADHYIDYLYYTKFRDWSVKHMFAFHNTLAEWRHKPNFMALEAFHTAEFQLAFLGVGLFYRSEALLLAFAGLMFHMLLDLIRLSQWKRIDLRALSFVEYVIRKRRMLKAGLHPETTFFQAYAQVAGIAKPPVQKIQILTPSLNS